MNPGGEALVEEVKGEGAGEEEGVVEGADVKAGAMGGFGAGAEVADFELADLVGEGLAGPGDVAVHFGDDVELGLGAVGEEVIDGLLSGPFLMVDAGVEHEADAAPEVIDELAEVVVRVAVETELVAEGFGVESPAFDISGEVEVAAELGQAGLLLGEGDLKVMARDGFMQGEGHHFPFGSHVGGVQVDSENARTTSVCGGSLIVSGAGVGCGVGGDGGDGDGGLGEGAEEAGEERFDLLDEVFIAAEELVASVVEEAGVGAQAGEEFGLGAAEFEPSLKGCQFGEKSLHFGEADSVDFLGGEVGGGVVAGDEGVFFGTTGPLPSTDLGEAGGEVFAAEEGVEAVEGG